MKIAIRRLFSTGSFALSPRACRSGFLLISLVPLMAWGGKGLAQGAEPDPLKAPMGIEDRLGNTVPAELTFVNQEGKPAALKDYLGKRPVILTFNYYECPMLCTLMLNGLVEGLKEMGWTLGKEFDVLTVSIAPEETPSLAKPKRAVYLAHYGREVGEDHWPFLTGTPEAIQAATRAVGFRYSRTEATGDYNHPAALFVLTPEGKLARVLNGIQFSGLDLKLALLEASEGKIGTVFDRFLMYCFHYDASKSKYTLFAVNVMKLGALAAVGVLGGLLVFLKRREIRG